ncbi:MAG: hypothetical protein ABWW70_07640 [Thermoproteota archaeon]
MSRGILTAFTVACVLLIALSLAFELTAGRVAALVLAGLASGVVYTLLALRSEIGSGGLLVSAIAAGVLGSLGYTAARFIAYGAYTEKATSVTLSEFLTMSVKSGVFFAMLITSILFMVIPFLAAVAATMLFAGSD